MKRIHSFSGKIVSVRRMEKIEVPDGQGGMITKIIPGRKMDFYWERENGRIWLFSQRYTSAVHRMFRCGRRDYEIRGFRHWDRNPRMDKTISKIPVYMAYAIKEYA